MRRFVVFSLVAIGLFTFIPALIVAVNSNIREITLLRQASIYNDVRQALDSLKAEPNVGGYADDVRAELPLIEEQVALARTVADSLHPTIDVVSAMFPIGESIGEMLIRSQSRVAMMDALIRGKYSAVADEDITATAAPFRGKDGYTLGSESLVLAGLSDMLYRQLYFNGGRQPRNLVRLLVMIDVVRDEYAAASTILNLRRLKLTRAAIIVDVRRARYLQEVIRMMGGRSNVVDGTGVLTEPPASKSPRPRGSKDT